MTSDLKLGLTKAFQCNYLPEQQERLLIAVDEKFHNETQYNWLMNQGFRRSGDQIYRPHCETCNACQSIRVMAQQFIPSKSQKRLQKKNRHMHVKISHKLSDSYYPLYEQYINKIHFDGGMYPPNKEQFVSFLTNSICDVIYIELWDDEKLINVAVTDVLEDGLSAVYTFYDPVYRSHGLGMFSILKQIELTEKYHKPYLYLGYQIDACKKMNYKNRFYPHQRLINQTWQIINK